ncbi:hypothetical protein GTQ40_13475 [Flavobacteriaceae bacterium R38]|nr:hypothetical protein [Flavobacteriaceae bacterium R38]
MKKTFIFFFGALIFFSFTLKPTTEVYICKGKGSKRYHFNKNCRGLSRCSTKIHKTSLKHAKELGRTLCGWED